MREHDNNIRMIYDGIYEDGTCSEEKIIENSIFNSKTNYNAYVGYMYGNASSNNYEAEHNNVNSSTVKMRVENWFNDHFKEKKEISQNAIYCNSRKTTSFVINGVLFGRLGFASNNTGYNKLNKDYTYQCYNQNDRFSVNHEKSNNASNASVGLITYDEYILSRNESKETFLDIKDEYWTMTPDYFDGRDAYIYSIKNGNILSSKVNKEVGIRPVITVNNDIKYKSGDGSIDNPYIIGEN